MASFLAPFLVEQAPLLFGMLLLLSCSAFFSGAETALFSLDRPTLRGFEEHGTGAERRIVALLKRPRELLMAILLGNMTVNVLFFSISTFIAERAGAAFGNAALTAVGVASLLAVIVCGEVAPKSVALRTPRQIALATSLPISLLLRFSGPLLRAMSGVVERVVRFGDRFFRSEGYVTHAELKFLVEATGLAGGLGQAQDSYIREVLELRHVKVKQIMTPRVDVVAFDLRRGRGAFLELAAAERWSRVPVHGGFGLDRIIGVLRTKDVLFADPQKPLEALCRKVPYVPEQATVEALLLLLREHDTRIAIAVDEYGGTAGIVTLEDAVEEIVGEIEDEFDEARDPVKVLDDGRYILSGALSVREWKERFGYALEDPGVATLGGLVTALVGRAPEEGDRALFENLLFTVKRVRRKRVLEVLVETAEVGATAAADAASSAAAAARREERRP